jgi:hypothetical protein
VDSVPPGTPSRAQRRGPGCGRPGAGLLRAHHTRAEWHQSYSLACRASGRTLEALGLEALHRRAPRARDAGARVVGGLWHFGMRSHALRARVARDARGHASSTRASTRLWLADRPPPTRSRDAHARASDSNSGSRARGRGAECRVFGPKWQTLSLSGRQGRSADCASLEANMAPRLETGGGLGAWHGACYVVVAYRRPTRRRGSPGNTSGDDGH